MRFLLKVVIPMDAGNAIIKSGRLGPTIQSILADLNPEAAYFTEQDGYRGGYIVVDVPQASDIPRIAEPFFLALNATVEFHPVMVPEDLEAAGPAIAAAVQKYAG